MQAADRVIALRPTSLIDKVWHLAQHFTDNGTFDKRTQPRVIPEIFLVRLLSAKVCLFVSAANKRLTSYDTLLIRCEVYSSLKGYLFEISINIGIEVW